MLYANKSVRVSAIIAGLSCPCASMVFSRLIRIRPLPFSYMARTLKRA
jgi:hypothetical protein